ncbi:MAG: hypothetical protein ACR2QK_04280, partial [Acidimicrobiales bacterium]
DQPAETAGTTKLSASPPSTVLENGARPSDSDSGSDSEPDAGFAIAPLPSAMTGSPCSVITDGSPAVGEVAFATFDFTGPYELFHRTSIDIVGPSKRSALIPGTGDPQSVPNRRTFPFVVGGNMFTDDGFAVQALLVDGELKTRCEISGRSAPSPCQVTIDGDPKRGKTASVAYRPAGPYKAFDGEQTYILGWGKKSVMKSDKDAALGDGAVHKFVIDGYMFRDGPFEVRTALGDGAAHAVCQIG